MTKENRRCHHVLRWALLVFLAVPGLAADGISTPCEDPIEGIYLVALEKGSAAPLKSAAPGHDLATVSRSMAAVYGGRVRHLFSHAQRGFSVRMDEPAAQRLARDPRVLRIERNCPVRFTGSRSTAQWGLDRVDQSFRPLNGTYTFTETGAAGPYTSQVHAYVVDTGITPNAAEFGSRLKAGVNVVDPMGDTLDRWQTHGHGTAVASIIGGNTYGVAPGVFLYPVKIFDQSFIPHSSKETSSTEHATLGVDWVLENHTKPAVVNLSFEAGSTLHGTLDDKEITFLEGAINDLINAGVTVVAAANNNDVDACTTSPARVPGAVTVGATDLQDRRAVFSFIQASNWGSCLDLWAPGLDIPALQGEGTCNPAPCTFDGTSFSTPHVTGAAALYLSTNSSAAPATVANYLTSHATPGVLQGNLGAGSPNLLLFAKPAHACVSWSCTVANRTCTFDLSCSRMPFGLGYYWLDFGDGTTYYGGGSTVTHTYPAHDIYLIELSLLPWYALQPDPATACVNVHGAGVYGCSVNGLKPWE